MDWGIRRPRLSGEIAARTAAPRRPARLPTELATNIAYNFGRTLRFQGAQEADFGRLLSEWVDRRFSGTRLLPHVRAGFIAGFCGAPPPSPWRHFDPEA